MVTRRVVALLISGVFCHAAFAAGSPDSLLKKEFHEQSYSEDFTRVSEKTPVELIRALSEVEMLCDGENPNFGKAEQTAGELLSQYSGGEDQGLTFFRLAQMCIGHQVKQPDLTIKYAQKAIECPIGPLKTMQMLIYWGDAIHIGYDLPHGEDWPSVRDDILMKRLQVLKMGLDYAIHDTRQDLPVVGRSVGRDGGGVSMEELRRRNEEQMQARELVMYANSMIQCSDSAIDLVGWLYYFPPYTTEELREIAMEVLGDETLVNRLMDAAKKNMQVRLKHETVITRGAIDESVGEEVEGEAPAEGEAEDRATIEEAAEPPADTAAEAAPGSHETTIMAALAAVLPALAWILFRTRKRRPTDG